MPHFWNEPSDVTKTIIGRSVASTGANQLFLLKLMELHKNANNTAGSTPIIRLLLILNCSGSMRRWARPFANYDYWR